MKFNLGIISAWKDIQNYRDWISTINREKNDPNSLYNKFGMDHNITYMIYFILSLSPEDVYLPDKVKKLRVFDSLTPINRYLDEDLGFAEYLVPEFNLILDEDKNPTLDYVIAYRFATKTIGIKWFFKMLIGLIGLIYIIIKIPWQNLISWILNLI